MIVIISSAPRERTALGVLCGSCSWPWAECDSLRAFKKLLRTLRPAIVIARQRIGDGYSDEIIAALETAGLSDTTKLVVLLPAGSPSSSEARQIVLGAELVQRDPVRPDVLVAYLQKFLNLAKKNRAVPRATQPAWFDFADARVHPVDRKLERGKTVQPLTPREIELAEMLAQSAGNVVSYETLYDEILGRRFQGDTSNLRVLLGKLTASAREAGIDLPRWVEVIPKLGYRYHAVPRSNPSAR